MCSNKGGGSKSSGVRLEPQKDYTLGYDNEFSTAVGKRLSKNIQKANSNQQIIDALNKAGFKKDKYDGVTKTGSGGTRTSMGFTREKTPGKIESLAIKTESLYSGGQRYFYLQDATYSYINT